MRTPNFLSGGELDRAASRRPDDGWLEEQWSSAKAAVFPWWRSKHLLVTGDLPRIAALPAAEARAFRGPGTSWALLGTQEDSARFALDVSAMDEPTVTLGLRDGEDFFGLREMGALIAPGDGALLAYAGAMMSWHHRHRYCGSCGQRTLQRQAGHIRGCTASACGELHFPRTDPAVIMLVIDGNRCLLGRQARWAPHVYSSLAGFVEPGESLEDAVRREVHEETGIVVDDVEYHSSQPWPFPGSLMLGFTARARTREIRVARDELEDARWFTRPEVRDPQCIKLPHPISIARRLIEDWLAENL